MSHQNLEKDVKKLDNVDLIYLAGFFDGEGNITIGKVPPSKAYKTHRYQLMVAIVNTNRQFLEKLREKWGGSVIRNSNTKPCYQWHLSVNLGYRMLTELLPYLQLKKEDAKIAIKFVENRKLNRGKKLSPHELAFRERCYQQLRKRR